MGRCAEYTNIQQNARGDVTHGECNGLLMNLVSPSYNVKGDKFMLMENPFPVTVVPAKDYSFIQIKKQLAGADITVGSSPGPPKEYTLSGQDVVIHWEDGNTKLAIGEFRDLNLGPLVHFNVPNDVPNV